MDMRKIVKYIIIFGMLINLTNTTADIIDPNMSKISQYFTSIEQPNNGLLKSFIYRMPKGADLHNHIQGAAYPDWLISYTKTDPLNPSWCVKAPSYEATLDNNCVANGGVLLSSVQIGSSVYNSIAMQWSMLNYPLQPPNYGHDHFFAAFDKFKVLRKYYLPQLLADLMRQAANEHINYLELFVKVGNDPTSYANKITTFPADPNSLTYEEVIGAIAELEQNNFTANLVNGSIIPDAQRLLTNTRNILNCNQPNPVSACQVTVKFLYPADRILSFPEVFTGLYAGFVVAKNAPDIYVGLNLLAPEDNPIAIQDYNAQMQLIQYLQRYFDNAIHVSLHAGELTNRLEGILPADLTFHINNAFIVAGGQRVGHGVDLLSELGTRPNLMQWMKNNYSAVEINLTSNEQILGVCDGETYCEPPSTPYVSPARYLFNHPLMYYLNNGAHVVLATDDQGIEQTDLNKEYYKAALRYSLTYPQLKNIDRDSLIFSFLPGQQLWNSVGNYTNFVAPCAGDNPYTQTAPSTTCQTYLNTNLKAQLEWNLEQQFAQFEGSPISISSCTQLQTINQNLNGSYVLNNDIDCSSMGWNWKPIGSEGAPFTGIFDGQNHTISNLNIGSNQNHTGLFGVATNAIVQNIRLVNVNNGCGGSVGGLMGLNNSGSKIINTTITVKSSMGCGTNNVGGLVGSNNGEIINSSSAGTINLGGGSENVGGLVGINSGNISSSFSTLTLEFGGGNTSDGGLVGFNNGGTITNSYYSEGSLNLGGGRYNVGGLVGQMIGGSINNSYAAYYGYGSGAPNAGGLVGSATSSSQILNSYYDMNTSGLHDTGKGNPMTTQQMYQQLTYTGWDFASIWKINSGANYPSLVWQK